MRLSDHVLPPEAVPRDEDVGLTAAAGLVLAHLRHRAIRRVVHGLLNIVLTSHDPVFVVDVGLAEFIVPAWALLKAAHGGRWGRCRRSLLSSCERATSHPFRVAREPYFALARVVIN